MTTLTIEEISTKLKEKFGENILSEEMLYDFPCYIIKKESIISILRFLYDDESLQFRYLTTMCGLHYPESKEQFGMMYQLHSLTNNLRIRFKSFTTANDLEYETATGIFSSANWMEREAWDFYGIKFKGHPNLKRILNVEDMDYHPLRKEYPLEDFTRTDKNDTMFGRDGNEKIKV